MADPLPPVDRDGHNGFPLDHTRWWCMWPHIWEIAERAGYARGPGNPNQVQILGNKIPYVAYSYKDGRWVTV